MSQITTIPEFTYALLTLDRPLQAGGVWRPARLQAEGWDNSPLWHEGERLVAEGKAAAYRVVHRDHVRGDGFAPGTELSGRIIWDAR